MALVNPKTVVAFVAAGIAACLPGPISTGHAETIIDEWASVERPPAPTLKPVTVDTGTTALLMLDFMNQNCGKRPRCLATIPAVKMLLAQARSKNMVVIYALVANTTTADVIKEVAPVAGEPWVRSGPDKFLGTDLEKMLKEKGIKAVITVGTAANGAVLYTASAAVFRGMKVIVPVDGISSADAYSDLSAVAMLARAPRLSTLATLTAVDMMQF